MFGRKKKDTIDENIQQTELEGQQEKPEIGPDEVINAFDAYGRRISINKLQWVEKVLPQRLKDNWDNADALYGDIILAVNNGCYSAVLDAAKHQKDIDKYPERGYVVLAIVYLKLKEYELSEAVLNEFIEKNGKTGVVLTNIAKIYDAKGDKKQAQNLLWEAVTLDPNQENGLAWWLAVQKEAGDKQKYHRALQTVCQLEGAYLAKLYLARFYLEEKQPKEAIEQYQALLASDADKPKVLFMMSGDLGKNGYIKQMISLIEPVYDVHKHDPRAGVNLLHGYLATRQQDKGQKLLSELLQLPRPDLRPALMQVSGMFDQLKQQDLARVDASAMKNEVMGLDKPILYYGLKDGVIPSVDKTDKKKIGILVFANPREGAAEGGRPEVEDEVGRLTRSIPLFIQDMLYFYSDYEPIVLCPVVYGAGPIVVGSKWEEAALQRLIEKHNLDLLITGEVKAMKTLALNKDDSENEQNTKSDDQNTDKNQNNDQNSNQNKDQEKKDDRKYLIKAVVKAPGALTSRRFKNTYKPDELAAGVNLLMKEICQEVIGAEAAIDQKGNEFYQMPQEAYTLQYLSGLAQSLTQTFIQNEVVPKDALWGERNILNWYLQLALSMPENMVMKILLVDGLIKSKTYGSEVYKEYKSQVSKLIDESMKKGSTATEVEQQILSKMKDQITELYSESV